MRKLFTLFFFTFFFFTFLDAQTGTWTQVATPSPHANEGVCLLMTDGTVICHNVQGGTYGTGWDRLTPDAHGSYANGTWDTIASMINDRLFFSSQVLPSGKVYVAGGEYGPGGTAGEVYDPVTNTWTLCGTVPSGWNIYDAPSELLYNGNVLEGPEIGANAGQPCNSILQLDPTTLNYLNENPEPGNHDEAVWVKLPDSTVLTISMPYPNNPLQDSSCRFQPATNTWLVDSLTPNNIYDQWGFEAGGGFLLPNGQAIFFGATQYNDIYTPSGNSTTPGSWSAAANFPVIEGSTVSQDDASSAMLVNGHILLAAGPEPNASGEFYSPCYFIEYDYTTNTFTQVMAPIPTIGGDSIPVASYQTQMLDLPDGTVLVSVSQTSSYSNSYLIYTPGSGPIAQGKPTINNVVPDSCNYWMVTGKLFNGISDGASYGDDWQMSTNYPIIRVTDGTNVYYAKTSNWNRIGAVMTDSLEDSAYFTFPTAIPGGTYSLVVVANGIASNPVLFSTFGLSITSQTNITCSGLGSATVFAADGAQPYTYLWMPGGTTTATATGLSAGIYTVTVSANSGCSISTLVNITQPTPLSISINTIAITCNGGNNGSGTAVAGGGISPYTYSWIGGSTNATFSGLSLGTYTLTVHDSCGNSATASTTITQPNVLSASVDSVFDVPCHGYSTGQAIAYANPGTPPYTYSWSGGAGTNAYATGLSAGTYTVTITDSCGNSATSSVIITEPTAITVITDSINSTSGNCNGEAWVIASGGTSPYTYLWTTSGQTTDTITGQCAGSYCYVVTDSYGCEYTGCVNVVVTAVQNIESARGQVTVYPNPGNGVFAISIKNYESGAADIEVYNVLGQNVYSNTLAANRSRYTINLSSQPDGLYLYRIVSSTGSLIGIGKLVIQK